MPKNIAIHIILFFVVTLHPFTIVGQVTDKEKKAGYLVKFISNTTWPNDVIGSEFIIGFIGDKVTYRVTRELIDGQLLKIGGQNRPLKVKYFRSSADLINCPMVYVTKNSPVFLSEIFGKYQNAPTLIVTEQQGFLERGSGINFSKFGANIGYEINQKDLENKNISINSSLTRTAIRVIKSEAEIKAENNPPTVTTNLPPPVNNQPSKDLLNAQSELEKQRKLREDMIRRMNLSQEEEDSLRKVLEEEKSLSAIINEQLQAEVRAKEARSKEAKAKAKSRQEEQKRRAAQQNLTYTILLALVILASTVAGLTFYSSRRRKKIITELKIIQDKLDERIREVGTKNEMLEESAKMMDRKNQEIRSKNEQLTRSADEIQLKNDELEEQNQKITDSIRYALTIQQAMLPKVDQIAKCFSEVFIIYQPKDIVSGDFYWFSHLGEHTFLAAIDCTGHGVPGAFMSAIGTDLLNEIINEKRIFDPAEALNLLHLGIYERLQQHDSKNRDGMDVCLCMFEPINGQSVKTTFAGAKRPLYYTLPDGSFERVSGTNKYIGGIMKENHKFSNQVLTLPRNTNLYLTTDGYVDTPNARRRKLGSKRLHELITEIADQPLKNQEQILTQTLEEHRGDVELRDDITLIGVKL